MSDSTAIVKRQPLDFLENKKFVDKLAQAIPNAMLKPGRLLQLALTLIKGSAKLMQCTPISLMACVMEATQLGLELDPVLGHAYMVPFKDEATLIIGYKGFAQLMYQSGQVVGISAEIVRAKDKFKRTLGTERKLIHDPAPVPAKDRWESWRGAYAVARMITDTVEFEYMEAEEIFKCRNRSRSWQAYLADPQKSTPWETDAEAMWEKTPLRRLAKRMPRSTTENRGILLRAVMLDEYAEADKKLLKPTEDGFVIEEDFLPEQPGIQPTLEKQLQDSIEYVETKKVEQDAGKKGGKPPREKKKQPKEKAAARPNPDPATPRPPGPPRANIPPAAKIDDPVLTVNQQTTIFHYAMQAGWKVPEEFNVMLEKKFKIKSIRDARNSQYAELLAIAKGDRA